MISYRTLVLLYCISIGALKAEPLIMLNFRPYPIINEPASAKEFVHNLTQPGKNAYNKLRGLLEGDDLVSGIFCTYAGFISVSDIYGHVEFPKLQVKPLLYILITTRAIPIILSGNTIHHWEIEESVPSQMFKIEEQQDPDSKLYFWSVEQVDLHSTLINQLEIPVETVIVFAAPHNIFIPEGISIEAGDPSPHFILPPLYVRKSINKLRNALYVLNLKYFFRKIRSLTKTYPDGYSSLMYR